MKKLFSLVLVCSVLFSYTPSEYEYGVGLGINSLVDHPNFDTPSFQFTVKKHTNSAIKPRFDVDYLSVDITGFNASSLLRLSLNALYDFNITSKNLNFQLSPLLGIGYEILDEEQDGFENQFVIMAGLVLEKAVSHRLSLRGEYKLLQVLSSSFDENMEHQFILGLKIANTNIRKKKKEKKVKPIIIPKPQTTVEVRKQEYIKYIKNTCLIEDFPEQYIPKNQTIKNCLLVTELNPYTPTYIDNVKTLTKFLSHYPTLDVYVHGYVDDSIIKAEKLPRQNNRYNKVKTDLVKFGMNKNQLKSNGYGLYHPILSKEISDPDKMIIIIKPSLSHLRTTK